MSWSLCCNNFQCVDSMRDFKLVLNQGCTVDSIKFFVVEFIYVINFIIFLIPSDSHTVTFSQVEWHAPFVLPRLHVGEICL